MTVSRDVLKPLTQFVVAGQLVHGRRIKSSDLVAKRFGDPLILRHTAVLVAIGHRSNHMACSCKRRLWPK